MAINNGESGLSVRNKLNTSLALTDAVTATAAEINVLDGITATVTELNYTDGVTSPIQTQLGTKVPYSGATSNLNLGENGLLSGFFQADLTPTSTLEEGRMQWNSTDGTLDLRLLGNQVTLQVGQEQVTRIRNNTGSSLLEANYQVVYITGSLSSRVTVSLAIANGSMDTQSTLGLVTEDIVNNAEGFITNAGLVRNINTTGSLQSETWVDGDILYLSASIAGRLTKVAPTSPNDKLMIGVVVRSHINQGAIFVKVGFSEPIEDLSNVLISSPTNNQGLFYESSSSLWKNKSLGTVLGLTSGSVLFANGSGIAQDNANLFWDDTNNRLGIGTSVPDANLDVYGTIAINGSSMIISSNKINQTNDYFFLKNNNNRFEFQNITNTTIAILTNTGLGIGLGSVPSSAKLHIKGSGTTSATTSLLVQNSAGVERLKVRDDGRVYIGLGYLNPDAQSIGMYNQYNSAVLTSTESSNIVNVFLCKDTHIFKNTVGAVTGQVGINTISPNASAALQVDSTTSGFLPPRMTTTQKNAISSPANGLVVFDTTLNKLAVFTTAWETITSA